MGIHRLDSIFNPKRITLIGASINPESVSGKVLNNLVGGGFRGVVYPVNPTAEAVMGINCYHDVKSLPRTPDLAVICTQPEQVPQVIKECGEAGINGVIIMTAGFREEGAKGKELEDKTLKEAKNFKGMRIIGPNCLGIIVPQNNLNVSFAKGMPKKGSIAFISQSGALCTSVLDWAIKENIGFSHFVSIGNTLEVDFGDLIDYFGEDESTKSILLYIESISNARKFMTAARSFAHTKPIVAYKAGRFPESAKAAASHTGAMAAEDDVYNAAFERAGITRVYDIGDIFDFAELIGKNKPPHGSKLCIVTNAGGPGVMATDALIECKGTLAELYSETINKLNEALPPSWSHSNPVDVLGDARSKRMLRAVQIVLDDNAVDAVLVILTPQAMTNPEAHAEAISKLASSTQKPILAAWMGGESMAKGIDTLNKAGVATYPTPEQAVRAFMTLVTYSRNIESLYETPRDIPVSFTIDRNRIRMEFTEKFKSNGAVLSEEDSKSLLDAYGIPVSKPLPAPGADEAIEAARKTGYPVVLKILSPDITHKTDVGGVVLNIQNDEGVRLAFQSITESTLKKEPGAKIEGVTVQPMINTRNGVELLLGIKKDNVFGTVIMAGMGGVTAELFKDKALGLPPLNEKLALQMLEELKIFPLLKGYRGRPPVNMDKLIEVLIRLSYLAADFPEISELDVNPLLVTPNDVIALDARIITDKDAIGKQLKPYAHLALRPYPEEYVKRVVLPDSTPVIFRPIKPEDEPLWMELLGSCSKDTIYSRFRYFFRWDTHEAATHYCYIDYDREIAIVAEADTENGKKLVGVGRLIADPDHESVEFAVLIADKWQNKDLGSMLTDYCMEISKNWGLKKIVAQTTSDNQRMINVLQKRGFEITPDVTSSIVDACKVIG
jgi:acetyltransferase